MLLIPSTLFSNNYPALENRSIRAALHTGGERVRVRFGSCGLRRAIRASGPPKESFTVSLTPPPPSILFPPMFGGKHRQHSDKHASATSVGEMAFPSSHAKPTRISIPPPHPDPHNVLPPENHPHHLSRGAHRCPRVSLVNHIDIVVVCWACAHRSHAHTDVICPRECVCALVPGIKRRRRRRRVRVRACASTLCVSSRNGS